MKNESIEVWRRAHALCDQYKLKRFTPREIAQMAYDESSLAKVEATRNKAHFNIAKMEDVARQTDNPSETFKAAIRLILREQKAIVVAMTDEINGYAVVAKLSNDEEIPF